MGTEDIISKSYHAIRTAPAAALPITITWIPSALMALVFSIAVRDFAGNFSIQAIIAELESNPSGMIRSAIDIFSPHVAAIVVLIIIAVIAYYYVRAAYPAIAKSVSSRGQISLSGALQTANKRFAALLWTELVFLVIFLALVGASIAASAAMYAAFGGGGLALGLLLSFAAFFAVLAYTIPMDIAIDGIVVLENKSGIEALKDAYLMTKNKKLNSWGFALVLGIITSVYYYATVLVQGMFSYAIGSYSSIILLVLPAFSTAFANIARTLFYFEIKQSQIPE